MSKVFPIRAAISEREHWQQASDLTGLSFNAWARKSLNHAAELEKAIKRQEAKESGVKVVTPPEASVVSRLFEKRT